MINRLRNVSAYEGTPPEEDGDRRITGGPLYCLEAVTALAGKDQVTLWSAGAIRDAEKWSLDVSDVARLIECAVRQGRYRGSEWCIQKPKGPWAACDVYTVTVDEWVEAARRNMPVPYYLKFCIAKTGSVLLLVSNHPEGT